MPRLKLRNVDLYYEVHGEGPCVVFVHGSGGNHLSWWQQIPTLEKQFRCIVLDQRNFGFSRASTPCHDPSVLCDDFRSLLDHLGITRAHFVGQSMGGHYCLRFALTDPGRIHSLVLAATLAGIADSRITNATSSVGPASEDLIERALSPSFRSQNPKLRFLYQMIERVNHVESDPHTLVPPDVSADELTKLRTPILFLASEHDPVAPATAVAVAAGLVPGAKFQVIPNSGHSAYFEQADAFNQALSTFFAARA